MSDRKLVCISFDAMVREDIDNTLKNYPHFAWLLENGAQVETMRTIYPSITYPAHTSLMTGVAPGRHGVTANEVEIFGKPGILDWNWYDSAIKPDVRTIFEEAHDAGMTTGAIFWPVTGNNPAIDYLIAEIWENDPVNGKTFPCRAFRASGTREDIVEDICRPHEHFFTDDMAICGPTCDNFISASGCDFIRRFNPDLLFLHFGFADHMRHTHGMFSKELTDWLPYADKYLGALMDASKEAGTFDQTNWVVLSDHGQMDMVLTDALNVKFAEDGLIRLDADGNVTDWDCFSRSTSASAEIFLRDKTDKALEKRVFEYLTSLKESGEWGIERVYTEKEAREEEQLYGNFSFVVEGGKGTMFSNAWTGPSKTEPAWDDRGNHGYHPEKGPQPIFIAAGPSFRKGAVLKRRSVLDVAPTLARAMGFEMTTADGSAMEELLK